MTTLLRRGTLFLAVLLWLARNRGNRTNRNAEPRGAPTFSSRFGVGADPCFRARQGPEIVGPYFFSAKSQTVQLQYMPPPMLSSRFLIRFTTRVGLPHSGQGVS